MRYLGKLSAIHHVRAYYLSDGKMLFTVRAHNWKCKQIGIRHAHG